MDLGVDARRLTRLLRWICGPLALLFLLAVAWRARGFVAESLHRVDWPLFLGAVSLWTFSHLVAPALAWALLRADGVPLRYRQALAIHVSRLPARYVPGGIWHTVSRVVDYADLGATRRQLGRLLVLENTLPLGMTLTLAGGILLWRAEAGWLAGAALAAGVALLLLAPLLLRGLQRFASASVGAGTAGYAAALAATALFWPVAAAAFCVYWLAMPVAATPLLTVAATYLLSWAAGFAMILSPQGAGVFEATFAVLAGGPAPFADMAVLAAGFRVVVLAADLAAFAVYVLLQLGRKLRGPG